MLRLYRHPSTRCVPSARPRQVNCAGTAPADRCRLARARCTVANLSNGTTVAKATGHFDVQLHGLAMEDIPKEAMLGRMSIDKQFHGDLEGTSKGQMLTSGTTTTGSAVYVAVERVTGTLAGKKRFVRPASHGHDDPRQADTDDQCRSRFRHGRAGRNCGRHDRRHRRRRAHIHLRIHERRSVGTDRRPSPCAGCSRINPPRSPCRRSAGTSR